MKFIDLYDDINDIPVFINLNNISKVVFSSYSNIPDDYLTKGYHYVIGLHYINGSSDGLLYRDLHNYHDNINRLAEALNLDFEIEDEEK